MGEHRSKYESYMKHVTDGFIEMQTYPEQSFKERIPFKVIWDGGVEYTLDYNYDFLLVYIDYEEIKNHNSKIAKEYLKENAITFDEWNEKYGKK